MSLGFDNVDPNYPNRSSRSNTSTSTPNLPPPTASQSTVVLNPHSEANVRLQQQPNLPTSSSQMTVIPYAPSPPEAPTFASVTSEEELYGPERYSGYHRTYDAPDYAPFATTRPTPSPSVHLNPTAFMTGMQTDSLVHRDFKDELARAAGAVTPGISDVPYIRYALDALTQQREHYRGPSGNTSSDSDEGQNPRQQIIPQFSVNISKPAPVRQSHVAVHVDEEEPVHRNWQRPLSSPRSPSVVEVRKEEEKEEQVRHEREAKPEAAQEPERRDPRLYRGDQVIERSNSLRAIVENGIPVREKNHNPPRTVDVWRAHPDTFTRPDLEAVGYNSPNHPPPPLTCKPWILRTPSLLLLATLCLVTITALIFSAAYSVSRGGFTAYNGTIYGGQYFLFRVLPQLVGAVLLIYAQCVAAAVFRVFPLSAMASGDRRERRNAVFLPLYPTTSFLWPRLFGPWNIWVPTLVVLVMNFTLPLLSSLYTVVLVDGVWTWSTVQGVAWTLVAVYVSMLLATVVWFVYWRNRRTGMMGPWDVRSIADVVALVSQSNSLPQYRGLETVATRRKMRAVLDGTAERLGYWSTPDVPANSIFWGIGVPTTEEDIETEEWDKTNWAAQRKFPTPSDVEEPWAVRSRYLPWGFRDSQIMFFVVAGTILLTALIAISFTRSTDLRHGFLPGLSAGPLPGAFSPANFLYSFLPSLVGLVLFLGLQSLDLTLRILAPWGELAREEGSRAETSLLLDYAACLPWQATYKAIKNRHWRVAFVTFLSPLSILIPVLGGGLFMALTSQSGSVRMYPNLPIFGLLLALLVLYLAALVSLVPNRWQFRLPHAVTCLAEIMSFCGHEQLRTDEAFDKGPDLVMQRGALETALDCGRDGHRQGRWTFGAGRSNGERLGIKRFSKYTVQPKRVQRYDKYVRNKPISDPIFHDSGSFGR